MTWAKFPWQGSGLTRREYRDHLRAERAPDDDARARRQGLPVWPCSMDPWDRLCHEHFSRYVPGTVGPLCAKGLKLYMGGWRPQYALANLERAALGVARALDAWCAHDEPGDVVWADAEADGPGRITWRGTCGACGALGWGVSPGWEEQPSTFKEVGA